MKRKFEFLWSSRIKLGYRDGMYKKGFFFFIHCSHSEIALSELFRKSVSYFMRSYFATSGSFKRFLFFYFLNYFIINNLPYHFYSGGEKALFNFVSVLMLIM